MFWALALVLQLNLDYELLVVEDARGDAAPLVEALGSDSAAVRRQAIRALGRFERSELAAHVRPFLQTSQPVEIRIEAANALAQMRRPSGETLAAERNPSVRAAIYEALARFSRIGHEPMLPGLEEEDVARFGAVKGLEHILRTSDLPPSDETIEALRRVVRESQSSKMRQLAVLGLTHGGDFHRETLEAAWRDPDPLARRVAILGLKEWRDDPSYIVRYAALKVDPSCDRARAALADPSEHVVLFAIDLLGEGCRPEALSFDEEDGWRRFARALVSLARVDAASARHRLPALVEHEVWQARVYAARAAKILGDEESLEALRRDSHPNVVAEALVTPRHALEALSSDHYGLLMKALELLRDYRDQEAAPVLLDTLRRISEHGRATSRDPRRGLIDALRHLGAAGDLEFLLDDFDPVIAGLAAMAVSDATGETVAPETTRFAPTPLPPAEYLDSLVGARARIRMKEAGVFVIELLPEEAPLTSARFAQLAESGYYDGLTFHRIVPNFVLQGGSPGANEYVGTDGYLRDEVGPLSHSRGTLGISTRGRDTGDSQIFINLVDNYRLDHNYSVFARVVEGMDSVDRIQEGDVMERVEIVRR